MRVCTKCAMQFSDENKICRQCGAILEEMSEAELAEKDWALASSQVPVPAEAAGTPPRIRAALGLPSGSIRALLTLLIVAVVVVQAARGLEIQLLWTETLMIALAHYFTSRRLVNLSPERIRELTAEGQLEPESNPLFLPRNSIRTLIILAFAGLAIYLFQEGQLFQSRALPLLGVVCAYLLGIVARAKIRGWEDLKAGVVLLGMGCTAGAYLLGYPDLVPTPVLNATLALTLFYFGSR